MVSFREALAEDVSVVAIQLTVQSSHFINIASYHNWLVNRTVSPGVGGSNPLDVTKGIQGP